MRDKLRLPSWQWAIVVIIILVTLAWQARIIKNKWTYARGYEQEWVAGSLLDGYGYSFDPASAWLGPYGDGTTYTRTAWVEPLYTLIIAAVMKVFTSDGRLVLALFNIVWLGASAIIIFLLVGEIINYKVGLFTSLLFLILHACRPDVILYLGNAALGEFLYCLSAYFLLRCLKEPTLLNGIILGAVIGIANLNHAGSLLFAPLSALIVLFASAIRKAMVWQTSLVLLIATVTILSPWILRNYVVFDRFVPVRSGFGYQLYIGNPGLARTFTGLKFDALDREPPWTANSPFQSLRLLRNLKYDAALAEHSKSVVSATSANYQTYNEVERDHVFLTRSLDFIKAEPILSLKMLFWKTIMFLTYEEIGLGLISLAAILGGLLMIKDLRVAGLLLLVVGYMIPFTSTLPLYYRYRSPIEPMLFVLTGVFLGVCLQRSVPLWHAIQKRFGLLTLSANAIRDRAHE